MPRYLVVAPGLSAIAALAVRAWRSERPMLVVDCAGIADRIEPMLVASGERVGSAAWLDVGDRRRPVRLARFNNTADNARAAANLLVRLGRLGLARVDEADAIAGVKFAQALAPDAGDLWGMDTLAAALSQHELLAQAWPESLKAGRRSLDRLSRLFATMQAMPAVWQLLSGKPALPPGPLPRLVWAELAGRNTPPITHRCQLEILRTWVETLGAVEPERTVVYLSPPSSSRIGDRVLPTLPAITPLCVALTDAGGVAPAWAAAEFGHAGDAIELVGGHFAKAAETWGQHLGGDAAVRAVRGRDQAVAFVRREERWEAAVPRFLPVAELSASPVSRLRQEARITRHGTVETIPHAPRGPFGVLGSLFERLCDAAYLRQAWNRLVLDGTSAREGVDGVRLKAFGDDIDRQTQKLADELLTNRYRPLPPIVFSIPKPDGGERKIGLAAVRDRVAQRAFLDLVTPLFEPFFSEDSYGFRPGRGAHHALVRLFGHVRRGALVLAQADVRKCFDTLPHDAILRQFSQRVPEARMIAVLECWLRHGRGTTGIPDQLGIGVVQGWVLAPLLSNVVLDDLDQEMTRRGIPWLRYADDLAMPALSLDEAKAALTTAAELAEGRLALNFHPDKTSVRRLDEGWDYLGFRVGTDDVLAMAPDRLERAELALATDVDAMASLGHPAAVGHAIRRLGLRWDGLTNYYGRLGLTRAMGKQFDHLLAIVHARRERLPADARNHGAWLQLADRTLIGERWGAFGSLQTSEPDAKLLLSSYPEPPSVLQALDKPQQPARAKSVPAKALPDSATVAVAVEGRTARILRGGVILSVADDVLVARRKMEILTRVPLRELDAIEIHAFGVHWASQTAWQLADAEVALIVLSPCASSIAVMHTPHGGKPQTRAAQARLIGSPRLVAAAGAMMLAKIGNQAAVLRYLARAPARRVSETGAELRESADEIRALAEALDSTMGDASLDQETRRGRWMGYEGRAAATYWRALRRLAPSDIDFAARVGRGATDPVNQALNFGYGLLYAEVWRAVTKAGLDPGIGLLHLAPRSDGALVYDLVEELRAPLVDRLIWSLMGRGWQPHVAEHGGRVLLVPRDRWIVLEAWRRQRKRQVRLGRGSIVVGKLATTQARALAEVVTGGQSDYPAYKFRW